MWPSRSPSTCSLPSVSYYERDHERVVAQANPIGQHDREARAAPSGVVEPAGQIRRRHGDVATRDFAVYDVDRYATSSGRVSRLRTYVRVEIAAGHRVHRMRIQRVAVRCEREAGQLDLLRRLTADARARHLNPTPTQS